LFAKFGKVEKPFDGEVIFNGKSKVYKMKSLPIKILAEKHKEYRQRG